MAGKQVQRRRGTTAQHAPFTGALGEVTVDTQKLVEVVHDGTTPGGFPQASARDIAAVTAATDAKIALTVPRDSATGVAKIPKGTDAQRPVTPVEGDFRFNTTGKRFEGYTTALGWQPVGSDSIPLFSVFWMPLRSAIPAGFVVADGQLLSRATYPDAWAGMQASNVPNTSDATWINNPNWRGVYSTGDGSTTFRVPDYNGKSSGSLGAVFLRGDGAGSLTTPGQIQTDQFQGHEHSIFMMNYGGGSSHQNFQVTPVVGATLNSLFAQAVFQTAGNYLTDPINGAARVGTETRPINATGTWCVKLFGAVINPGAADAAQLATEVANIKADIQNNVYKRSNAVGTVAQSGGVPTGAIIEKGSNASGQYTKFADGTMICWNNINLGSVAIVAQTGSMYYATVGQITFPVAFASPPIYCHMDAITTTGVCFSAQGINFPTVSATQSWNLLSPSSGTVPASCLWVAIGRWFI